jgi:stage 0 sporulation regulatory protein
LDGEIMMKSLLLEKEKILKLKIEIQRKDMYKKVKDLGVTHPQVVNCSEELDVLLKNLFDLQLN